MFEEVDVGDCDVWSAVCAAWEPPSEIFEEPPPPRSCGNGFSGRFELPVAAESSVVVDGGSVGSAGLAVGLPSVPFSSFFTVGEGDDWPVTSVTPVARSGKS